MAAVEHFGPAQKPGVARLSSKRPFSPNLSSDTPGMSSWELGGSGAGPARQLLMQADELARRTQKTVIIATMNGLKVQHIYLNRSQDDLTTSAPSHIGMHCRSDEHTSELQ